MNSLLRRERAFDLDNTLHQLFRDSLHEWIEGRACEPTTLSPKNSLSFEELFEKADGNVELLVGERQDRDKAVK
jgi:hypothetical protein